MPWNKLITDLVLQPRGFRGTDFLRNPMGLAAVLVRLAMCLHR